MRNSANIAIQNNKKSKVWTKYKISNALVEITICTIITILCLTCILPFIHLLSKSLSSNVYVLQKSVYLLPKGLNFDAYISIFQDGKMVRSMGLTIFVTVTFTIVGMIATICAAYPLSKKELKGRNFFLLVFVFTLYFGAGLIPEYLLMKNLGLLNTVWVLILPLAFSPYNMLLMKTFLQNSIPVSLEESAFLDGANQFQVLFKIVLPLSKSSIATLSLFYAVGRWNAYADAKYYISKQSLYPIQLLLNNMVNASREPISIAEGVPVTSTPEVLQAACVMFATIPIVCVYPFVQKYFVKGVMIGAVKG